MSAWIANARMYAVTPAVEARAGARCSRTSRADAGVPLQLRAVSGAAAARARSGRGRTWARCSCAAIPIALRARAGRADRRPDPAGRLGRRGAPSIAPISSCAQDAPYQTLEDTFGGRAGWTVAHSQSGFNAFRHHLLGYRTPAAARRCTAQMHGQPRHRAQRPRRRARRTHRRRAARCLLAPADRPPRAASSPPACACWPRRR